MNPRPRRPALSLRVYTRALPGCLIAALLLDSPSALGAGQSDFGGVGLMQTPTARMAPLGHFAATYSRTAPYRRYGVFIQPTPWLEAGFRYVEIEDRRYGESIAGERNYLDKGLDAKFRLLEEGPYRPEVALGLRDAGGTTLFGAEYLVANKRFGDWDISLGLGWGYLGASGDLGSPLGWLDSRFDHRPTEYGEGGGEFEISQLFRGPAALFGGVEYQTPWQPLVLQLEYEGNDYSNEPAGTPIAAESRVNLGSRLQLGENVSLHAGWQRGDTLMAGVTVSANLAGLAQAKQDPPPMPLDAPARGNWQDVAEALEANAGMRVHELERRGGSVTVTAEPQRYRNLATSEGRAGRILHAELGPDVTEFRYRWQQHGLGLRESVHPRDSFVAGVASTDAAREHLQGVYVHAQLERAAGETLYRGTPKRFDYHFGPALEQNFGGPDGYLYRLSAFADMAWHTDANGWFSLRADATLADNLDKYDYIARSELPRVRTHIGDYLASADVGLTQLQYTRTAQLAPDWYLLGYGGLLEVMYAGIGGEVLYRPFNSRWALGLDVNRVRQREFDQRFALRDYQTWTGHLTAYVDTGFEDLLAKVSVGRYLAGDNGVTFDVSREFDNGVRVGGWATFTDAGDDFGEGSFDKALYLSIPLDAFFVRSSRDRADIAWQPLTRDGGARLNRRHSLYQLTQERDLGSYWRQFEGVWE
ncbi:YjbH domain-containing protein [Halomonas sp. MCCC 1A17488]|uniref:YjbH domain-containing protein n=1 Tax=unclassified Halomonas TaxID=2609666 RepID=UPI0018D22411|nr:MULTISPECIES: YjbH domain-containing protein [unclassified Halomonas]MCE8014821.1 YjbH domain-containing protein [Halomonas sp. MCCC 1A17488]MCG3238154.1 YjbH domain-containing protein [Halomonas sp. MCCC 1A17488]QPP48078.1 YjbH domain-containing protein [Halomonas sp. SS10-MC5]